MKVLLVLLSALAAVSAVRITNCNSKSNVLMSEIRITGCDARRPACLFKRGQAASVNVPFIPGYQIRTLTAVVYGYLGPVPIPFPLPNDNACSSISGASCPIPAGSRVDYSTSIPVKSQYPALPVTVQLELQDEQGNNVVCIKFPVRLV